jgi:isopenicillin N synthase-like dioxygenase
VIPLIDIAPWRAATPQQKTALAQRVDDALQTSGFLLVAGHGVSPDLAADIRTAAREFFTLPTETKSQYATPVYGRGWVGPGREANSFYGEQADASRPDLKESFTIGRDFCTGDPTTDADWFAPNVWPAEVPRLRAMCDAYRDAMHTVYLDMLRICAVALGLDEEWFVARSTKSPYTFNINRYPPLSVTGPPAVGQYRVAPHTDWGILTLLDRQQGYGGLEVQSPEDNWVSAPYVPGALTVNIGDLLARWTGDRWRSTRHRVLPPQDSAPDEDLVSLIMFCETDVDTVVTSLPSPVGHVDHPSVTAGEYLLERGSAATVS